MCSFYEKIMEVKVGEDILGILKNWDNFSKNKAKFPTDAPLVLPDMLWVTKSGYGTTNLLTLLAEHMHEEKIMEFYGDVKFFEFRLEYCPKEAQFKAFDEFKDAVLSAAGFRNEFRGIVCVNISEWTDHINERYFVNFLEYLSENSDPWHIIFVTDCNNSDKLKHLEALLAVYFRIDKVVFRLPETQELLYYMEKRIAKYGFEINEEAKNILLETIGELRKSKYFDGYKTLNMICSDVVYRAFSAEKFSGYVITADMVGFYSKDSDFVKRTKQNIEKRNSIGYGLGGGGVNE